LRRQDHTLLPYAATPFVSAPFDCSQIRFANPPCITCHARHCRVHCIPPRVSDDPDTPLGGTGWEGYRSDLGEAARKYFGKTEK
jgi:hypothetical protein